MKKLGVILMASILLLLAGTTVSARTILDTTSAVPNPLELRLPMSVGARKSGTEDAFTPSLPVMYETNHEAGVDYKASLDMHPVRDLFNEGFFAVLMLIDDEIRTEFNAGIVTTTVQVVIRYPQEAHILADIASPSVGVLDAGSIFLEKSRRLNGNTLTITYENQQDLTAAALKQNKDTYLKDISFTLEDAVSYGTSGNHSVSITLSGSTSIRFATKTQVVQYVGTASHVVSCEEDLLQHILEVQPAVPATCIAEGKTEGIICRTHGGYDCGALGIVIPEATPKIDHVKVTFSETSATCVKTGIKAHETCSMCKTDFIGEEIVSHASLIIPPTGLHTPQRIPGVAPTCIKSGLTDGSKCSVCGTILTAQSLIPATGHVDAVVVPGYAATCTETGLTEGKKCACGEELVPRKIIPAKGHSFGEWTVTAQPTETAEGKKTRTCANGCGTEETVSIPKLQHVCVPDASLAVVTTEPSCTETGLKQQYCACGLPVGNPVEIPAKGHVLTHIAARRATCVSEGMLEHYLCSVCNVAFRDSEGKTSLTSTTTLVDRNYHGGNEVVVPGVAPTCTREGVSDSTKCKACNIVITPKTILAKAPHVMETIDYVAPLCEKNGTVAHRHCAVCDLNFEMDGVTVMKNFTIPAIGHTYGPVEVIPGKEPSETEEGEGIRRCLNDPTHTKTVIIGKVAHVHNELVEEILTKETCTESGLKRKVYSCCGEVLEDNIVIPPHSHTPILVPMVHATCYSEGVAAYYKCAECAKLFSGADATEEIAAPTVLDKTEHDWRDLSNNAEKHVKKCYVCHEVVNTKKQTTQTEVSVEHHGGMKTEEDRTIENVVDDVRVETDIKITEKEEVSTVLYLEIPEKAKQEKVALDIEVEKVTRYENSEEEEREIIKETPELIQIAITIPPNMRGNWQYVVYRLHGDTTHIITTTPNEDGEYIAVNRREQKITLHVKKFSEYALVALEEADVPGNGGVVSTMKEYTVTFRANGGSVVESVKVQKGNTITAPVTTREGYIFGGWFMDATYEKLFDFSAPITGHTTLYAKWIEKTQSAPTIILTIGEKQAIVYGYEVENDVAPKIVNDRTMLPIRFVAEALGARVAWDQETQTVDIILGDIEIQLTVGEAKAKVNGAEVALDTASFIENGRTYMPLRFVAENLGALVEWHSEVQKVTITKEQPATIVLTIGEKTAVVYGVPVENDVAPVLVNDRTMLPIRFVAEALGATVGWDEATRTVTIVNGELTIAIVIGEAQATVNGEAVMLDVAAFIENSRTYLPLRFVAENLGATVEWFGDMQKVVITK